MIGSIISAITWGSYVFLGYHVIRFGITKMKRKQKSKHIPTINVIQLSGIISNEIKSININNVINLDNTTEVIDEAFNNENKNIKSVFVVIDSPGGSPVQSEAICKRIKILSERKKIPVYTIAEDVAASGGY